MKNVTELFRVGYSNGILQIDSATSDNAVAGSSSGSPILHVSPETLVHLEASPDFCHSNSTAG